MRFFFLPSLLGKMSNDIMKAWKDKTLTEWINSVHWKRYKDKEATFPLINHIVRNGDIARFVEETISHPNWSSHNIHCRSFIQDEVFRRFTDTQWKIYWEEMRKKLGEGDTQICPRFKTSKGNHRFLLLMPDRVKKNLKEVVKKN